MKVTQTSIPDVLIIAPDLFDDDRGYFLESWNATEFAKNVDYNVQFVQDNHSHSRRGVLRGLHYQVQRPQGKLVRVVRGQVFDVAVDLRKFSPTFGRWVGMELSEDEHLQLWIPAGFAHGFIVLSESADFLYKTTDYYSPEHERCLIWNDATVGITWPPGLNPILTARDRAGACLRDAEVFP
jgi:dTDP-4-dehydrorhamnose 3,5-epimerase